MGGGEIVHTESKLPTQKAQADPRTLGSAAGGPAGPLVNHRIAEHGRWRILWCNPSTSSTELHKTFLPRERVERMVRYGKRRVAMCSNLLGPAPVEWLGVSLVQRPLTSLHQTSLFNSLPHAPPQISASTTVVCLSWLP